MWLHACFNVNRETPAQGFVQRMQLPVRYRTPIPLPRQKGEQLRPVYTTQFVVSNGVYLKQKRAYTGGTFEGIRDLEP